MAQNITNDQTATANHNAGEMKDTIRSVVSEIVKLKAERSEINEQITEARARVKAFGIKMTDLNVAIRLYELEAEDRNESIDHLKICFEALGIGGQGDMFPDLVAAE